MLSLIKKIVGTKNDREVKRIRPFVGEINELEAEFQKLADAELHDKTEQFKQRVRETSRPVAERFRGGAERGADC
jgi:preprotein translocase subunit SecA